MKATMQKTLLAAGIAMSFAVTAQALPASYARQAQNDGIGMTHAPVSAPNTRMRVNATLQPTHGKYSNGRVINRYWTVDGQKVSEGATYRLTNKDIGKKVIFVEEVENLKTGQVVRVQARGVDAVSMGYPSQHAAPEILQADQLKPGSVLNNRRMGKYNISGKMAGDGYAGTDSYFPKTTWYVDGKEVGWGYTLTAADVGKTVYYEEKVKNPQTGEEATFVSQKVVVGGGTAAPAPQPPRAEPPSVQPPAGDYLNIDEKKAIIEQIVGRNEVNVKGWHGEYLGTTKSSEGRDGATAMRNGSFGQTVGGSVVMGNVWKLLTTSADIQEQSKWGSGWYKRDEGVKQRWQNSYANNLQIWGVVFESEGSYGGSETNMKFQVRNQRLLVLRRGSSTWEVVGTPSDEVRWHSHWSPDMANDLNDINLVKGPMQGRTWPTPFIDHSNNVVTMGLLPHWPYANIHWSGPMHRNIPNPENIIGVMVSMEMKIDANTPDTVKMATHVGADPKLVDGSNFDNGVAYFPGVGLSRIQSLSKEWKEFAFVNVYGAATGDGAQHRTITQEQFLNTNVPRAK